MIRRQPPAAVPGREIVRIAGEKSGRRERTEDSPRSSLFSSSRAKIRRPDDVPPFFFSLSTLRFRRREHVSIERRYYCRYSDNRYLCNMIVIVTRCYCYPLSSRHQRSDAFRRQTFGRVQRADVYARRSPRCPAFRDSLISVACKRHLRPAKFKRDREQSAWTPFKNVAWFNHDQSAVAVVHMRARVRQIPAITTATARAYARSAARPRVTRATISAIIVDIPFNAINVSK